MITGACLLLSGCAVVALGLIDDEAETSVGEAESDWVVVTYTLKSGSPTSAMDVLEETELAADTALQDARAGSVDGNEVGAGEYQLYFAGPDRHRMWQVLEPVFASAPLKWSRVELYQALEEDPDEVILPRWPPGQRPTARCRPCAPPSSCHFDAAPSGPVTTILKWPRR